MNTVGFFTNDELYCHSTVHRCAYKRHEAKNIKLT